MVLFGSLRQRPVWPRCLHLLNRVPFTRMMRPCAVSLRKELLSKPLRQQVSIAACREPVSRSRDRSP
jgi:hypothetical protein